MDEREAVTEMFERRYAAARRDGGTIPWVRRAPHPELVAWYERRSPPAGTSALVVGAGLGDDAEFLAARGHDVTAFDASETALRWCRERFPETNVDYRLADLFALPAAWRHAFALVVEVFTIQSAKVADRDAAINAIAATVAPGGTLVVVALARPDERPPSGPPWPVSRRELDRFTGSGLDEVDFRKEGWHYVVEYRRPVAG